MEINRSPLNVFKVNMNLSKSKLKTLTVFQIFLIFFCCSQGNNEMSSTNYFSVSGKVINRDTGKGIPNIEIEIFEKHKGYSCEGITDKNGNFKINKVPKGLYEFEPFTIFRACSNELIITEMPETINVSSEGNVLNLKIFLQRGGSVSGYVYAADGVTPLKNTELEIAPWPPRVNRFAETDTQGKYLFVGLDGGKKTINHHRPGYANELVCINVQPGKTYKDVNFVLGKGSVSVSGRVISAKEHQIVRDVTLFFTSKEEGQNFSSGWTETDDKGEYSLIGLKSPGKFELSTVDMNEEYEDIESMVELKSGKNILDVKLKLKNVKDRQ